MTEEYGKGLHDALEAASALIWLANHEDLTGISVIEAIEMIKEWKEHHINVGDIVKWHEFTGAVTRVDETTLNLILNNGDTVACGTKEVKITGRTVDVNGLLEQIRGKSDD